MSWSTFFSLIREKAARCSGVMLQVRSQSRVALVQHLLLQWVCRVVNNHLLWRLIPFSWLAKLLSFSLWLVKISLSLGNKEAAHAPTPRFASSVSCLPCPTYLSWCEAGLDIQQPQMCCAGAVLPGTQTGELLQWHETWLAGLVAHCVGSTMERWPHGCPWPWCCHAAWWKPTLGEAAPRVCVLLYPKCKHGKTQGSTLCWWANVQILPWFLTMK